MDHKRGFTLVELLVAMAVSAIVFLGVISMFSSILNADKNLDNYVQAQDAHRIVSITVEKDIRSSSQNISLSITGTCTAIKDLNTDEVIEYCLSGNDLSRNGSLLSGNIGMFSLTKENEMINLLIETELKREVIQHEKTIHLR